MSPASPAGWPSMLPSGSSGATWSTKSFRTLPMTCAIASCWSDPEHLPSSRWLRRCALPEYVTSAVCHQRGSVRRDYVQSIDSIPQSPGGADQEHRKPQPTSCCNRKLAAVSGVLGPPPLGFVGLNRCFGHNPAEPTRAGDKQQKLRTQAARTVEAIANLEGVPGHSSSLRSRRSSAMF